MLNDTELLALNLVPTNKATRSRVRDSLEPSDTAQVDFIARVQGTIQRGEDTKRQGPLATADVHAVLAALRDLGIDRHASPERLTGAIERRYGTPGAKALVEGDKKLSRCLVLLQRAANKRKIPVAGKLDGSGLMVTALERSPGVRKAVGAIARKLADALDRGAA